MAEYSAKEVIDLSRLLIQVVCDKFEREYIKSSSPVHLSKNQFTILQILNSTSPLPVSHLAEILQISKAAASKSIDYLVREKMVRRQTISADRRTTMVYLLDSGRQLVKNFQRHFQKKHTKISKSFTQEELTSLILLLKKFVGLCLEHEKDIGLICVQCNGMIIENCTLKDNLEVCRYFYKKTIKKGEEE